MRKIDLIRKLLDFHDKMDDEVLVRIVTRDENGIVQTEQTCIIDSMGHFLYDPTIINITKSNITEERKI